MASQEPPDAVALLHALEVHQAELEQQNLELLDAVEQLRRSNTSLADATRRYRALQDLAPVPLLGLDAGGVIVDVNRASEGMLRAPRDKLLGRAFGLFVDEASRPAVSALLRDVAASGAVHTAEASLAIDGVAPVEAIAHAVVVQDEGHARTLVALVDVTTQKQAEREQRLSDHRATEAQRLESLGVLAGGIAHDFNNLLTVVLGGIDHAMAAPATSAADRQPLLEARHAALHAGALAHQMLAYSGRVAAPMRALDLGAVVDELTPLIQASAQATRVTVRRSSGPCWFTGDDAQLRQIVLNLVINAAEAMRDRPGCVEIATYEADAVPPDEGDEAGGEPRQARAYVVLEVGDSGPGMDAATRARIFEPYFTTKFTGRGLGLAVVQGIVRGHGATLRVTSRVDHGTTFRVFFPAVPAPSDAPASGGAARHGAERRGGTVLLVDDEPAVRRTVKRTLERQGFDVLVACDGAEAVEVFRGAAAGIAIVLMDLTMPRMGGVEASAAIRELRADVPIVLVTGYGEVPPDAGCLFAATLPKPFRHQDLEGIVARLLPGRLPRRS